MIGIFVVRGSQSKRLKGASYINFSLFDNTSKERQHLANAFATFQYKKTQTKHPIPNNKNKNQDKMVMNNAQGTQNYLYLYDLPKAEATSTKLASVLQTKTGIVLTRIPQIRRDLNRPFYSAVMQIPEEDKFILACKEMRYFELAPGKPSRALPFDNDLLGSNP